VNSDPVYAAWQTNYTELGNVVYGNDLWSASGSYTDKFDPESLFTFGPNNINTNPSFANPAVPGAPSCGSASSAPNCMATVIANFTPTNATLLTLGYGYQIPSATQTYDPLFPQWLCNVNLPSGLVTMGCLTGSSTSNASLSNASLH
jgi:hypothetical protein